MKVLLTYPNPLPLIINSSDYIAKPGGISQLIESRYIAKLALIRELIFFDYIANPRFFWNYFRYHFGGHSKKRHVKLRGGPILSLTFCAHP